MLLVSLLCIPQASQLGKYKCLDTRQYAIVLCHHSSLHQLSEMNLTLQEISPYLSYRGTGAYGYTALWPLQSENWCSLLSSEYRQYGDWTRLESINERHTLCAN